MMAEMRAYGEGFIIADQIPTKLAPETENSNGKIYSPPGLAGLRAAGSCVNLTDWESGTELKPGLAIVLHD